MFDPDTCSWRTSQLCLLGGWIPFSERWPRSGMMLSGTVYRLPPLVPRISGTGFSSSPIPTPTAQQSCNRTANRSNPDSQHHDGVTLSDYVKLWPTPQAMDGKRGADPRDREGSGGPNLLAAVKLWPTPTSRDWKTGSAAQVDKPRSEQLNDRVLWATPQAHPRTHSPRQVDHGVQLANQVSGQLNPTWVEWLMGFPLGWTDCGDSAMPSSPKSPSTSGDG